MEELLQLLEKIKPGVPFREQGDLLEMGTMDSLDILEIIDEIEEHYHIEILAEDIDPDNFRSVEAMLGFVNQKLHLS